MSFYEARLGGIVVLIISHHIEGADKTDLYNCCMSVFLSPFHFSDWLRTLWPQTIRMDRAGVWCVRRRSCVCVCLLFFLLLLLALSTI